MKGTEAELLELLRRWNELEHDPMQPGAMNDSTLQERNRWRLAKTQLIADTNAVLKAS